MLEIVLGCIESVGTQILTLSRILKDVEELRKTDTSGHQLVQRYPTHFGLLTTLPTNARYAWLEALSRTLKSEISHGRYVSISRLYVDTIAMALRFRTRQLHVRSLRATSRVQNATCCVLQIRRWRRVSKLCSVSRSMMCLQSNPLGVAAGYSSRMRTITAWLTAIEAGRKAKSL